MEETEYYGQCYNCEVETEVLVYEESELPLYCPMCGVGMEYKQSDD
tara:strand:+ start:77 stop:214 length:138 start_codon:yes stop_codon:yes gene_type:complete